MHAHLLPAIPARRWLVRAHGVAIALAVLGVMVVTVAATVSGWGALRTRSVAGERARTAVEIAAQVRLEAAAVSSAARHLGLRAAFSNAPTAVADRQQVVLYALRDRGAMHALRDVLAASATGRTQVIAHENLVVVYDAAGADRAQAIRSIVDSL